MRWIRPESKLMLASEITLHSPWWKLEEALTKEAKQQRIYRLASEKHHQDLITGLDWHTYHQVKKTLKQQHKHHLDTWVQAAIQFRDGHQPKSCPICHVPATPKHILWLCRWHCTQQHEPMPPEWMDRLTCQDEELLWAHGWIPLEP